MKEPIRVMLVDPVARSRRGLQTQLRELVDVELVETIQGYATAIERIAEKAPDLLIVVTDEDLEESLKLVSTMAGLYPGVRLLPAGTDHDGSAIMRAIRAGAREYLPLPATTEEVKALIERLCPAYSGRSKKGPRGPRVIAVTGAAGGVGCTSIAVNLSTTLCKLSGCETVLADYDLLLGSLEESLGVSTDHSLEVLLKNFDDMDSALLKRWLPRHACGLYVVPHPAQMEASARLDPEGLYRVLELLKESFETVVIDTSKSLQSTDFLAFVMADVILVVMQLNLNCIRNSVRLINYLRQFEGLGEKVQLVVNRINSPLSEISVKKAEELLVSRVKWKIPNATRLFRTGRAQGVPIDEVEGGAGSKGQAAILELAKELQPFPLEVVKVKRRLFAAFR